MPGESDPPSPLAPNALNTNLTPSKVLEALKKLAQDQDRKLSPTINLVCRDHLKELGYLSDEDARKQ